MRYLFFIALSVVIARWSYHEIGLICPGAIPYIDLAVQAVDIPTHNEWNKDKIADALQFIEEKLQEKQELAKTMDVEREAISAEQEFIQSYYQPVNSYISF